MMNYTDFINKCKTVVKKSAYHMLRTDCMIDYVKIRAFTTHNSPYVCVDWCIGGAEGGNCWGDMPESFDGEPERDFTFIDNYIKMFLPSISNTIYNELNNLIKTDEYTDGADTYGNFCTYKFKYISLKEMYDYLTTHNLLIENEV